MSNLTLDSLTLPNGVRLPYADHGDPDGIPVLMLHGWTDSWRSFEPILAHLPESIRAIAVTQRGHGDADRPQSGYAIRELAADAVAVLDALGIERAIVCGHSMGAWVTTQIAVDNPQRLLGAVLAGTVGPIEADPELLGLAAAAEALTDPVDPEFVREFQAGTTARALPEGQLDLFVEESLKLPARVWAATARAFRDLDVYANAARVAVPTLIIWGDQDAITGRATQDALLRAIPAARLNAYEGTGHAVQWEEPERFAADVAAFASEVA